MYTLLGEERRQRHVYCVFTFENGVLKNMLLHSFLRLLLRNVGFLFCISRIFFKRIKKKLTIETAENAIV